MIFEGNIGVGKTSLAQKIAKQYQIPSLMENFKKNPFLKKFYDQPETYALRKWKIILWRIDFSNFSDFLRILAGLRG